MQAAHTPFFGRVEELAVLVEAVRNRTLVSLVGTGGVGKTRMASELTLQLASELEGGAWLVELGAVERDEDIRGAVQGALGITTVPDGGADPLLADLAARGPALLVLDNCEHLLDPVAELVDEILRSGSPARVLCTSREPLALADELVIRLGVLHQVDAEAGSGPAEQLFLHRARQSGAELSPADLPVVADICRLLDDLPLAVELAASRAGASPVQELRELLTSGDPGQGLAQRRGGERRQRSLDELVDWSFQLLSTEEQTDLLHLTGFPHRFTARDATVLLEQARGPGRSRAGELARRGLIDRDGDRYRLLFSVRTPLAARLASQPELAKRTDEALAKWALQRIAIARQDGWTAAAHTAWEERLNLEAGLRAALRSGVPVPRVVQMLRRVWSLDGVPIPVDLGTSMAELARRRPVPRDPDEFLMRLSARTVSQLVGMSAHQTTLEDLDAELIAVARALEHEGALLETLSTLAPSYTARGEFAQAGSMLREAIGLAPAEPVWHRPARDLVNLGVSQHVQEKFDEALVAYEQAVVVAAETGDEDNLAAALLNTADVLLLLDQPARASEYIRRGIRGARPGSTFAIVGHAMLAQALLSLADPRATEIAIEAERDLARFGETDPSMNDYLERLRAAMRQGVAASK